jgi:cardiolipin synthase
MKSRCNLFALCAPVVTATLLYAGLATVATPAQAASPSASTITRTLVIEPDQGLTPIYNLIQSATSTIDMTMYELVDAQAQSLLCQAAANGVAVRVILDQNLEYNNNLSAYNQLNSCGATAVWAWTKYDATHEKAIVVDGTTAAIMTLNLTSRYYSTSRDFAVIENDAADVAAIESTFSADFASQTITPPVGDDLVWSPTNSKTQLLNVINSAQSTLQVENEEMSYSTIVTALENAAKRGVAVTVCMTNDANDYATEFNALKKAGVNITTYAETAPLYIHAKAIVADYGTTNARAFVGSENFSSASLNYNRELGLVTTDATVLSQLNTTLSSDYAGGTAW